MSKIHYVTFITDCPKVKNNKMDKLVLLNVLSYLKTNVDDIDEDMLSTDTQTCILPKKRRRSPRTSCCGFRSSTKVSFGSYSMSCASVAVVTWPRYARRRRRAAASMRKCMTTRQSDPCTRSSSCLIPTTGGAASRLSATSDCANDESRYMFRILYWSCVAATLL